MIRYHHAITGAELEEGDKAYALELMARWFADAGQPVPPVAFTRALPDFAMDYVSVYKRLPVQRIALREGPVNVLFLETHTGHVAHLTTPEGRLRSQHFMHLHKFHFLGKLGLSPAARDLVISIVVLLILALVLLGMSLVLRRRRTH